MSGMLLMGKEGESRARRRLPGSDAVRPRHRRWSCVQRRHHQAANRVVCGGAVVPKRSTTPSGSHSSIPAASPTGDRHDDQADDGILSISCPEVSLGSLRSTGRARSPRQVRGRFRRQIHISKVKGMLRDSFAAPHGGGVASIVFERPSTPSPPHVIQRRAKLS